MNDRQAGVVGPSLRPVQAMLGQQVPALTLDTYAGLFPDDLEAVADAFDAAVEALAQTTADALRTEFAEMGQKLAEA
jgi:hypothetical protein